MSAQADLDEIVDVIARRFAPERIILFGSRARGDAKTDSDIDLLVLFAEVEDPRAKAVEMYAATASCRAATDILVSTTGRFERFKDIVNTIYWPAAREGKVLYERAA
jgi:uncharacterized protein